MQFGHLTFNFFAGSVAVLAALACSPVTVAAAGKTASVTSLAAPASGAVNAALTMTASVTPNPDGGTISFSAKLGKQRITLPCADAAATAPASCTFTPTAPGDYTLSASFSGTRSLSTSSASRAVSVKIATTVTLSDNATTVPGSSATPVVFGGTVIFTARVAPVGGAGGTPQGSVQWTLGYDGPPQAATGLGACTASSLSTDGVATCMVTPTTYEDWSGGGAFPDILPFNFPINATATFVPAAGTSWTGSAGAGSTSKISIGKQLPAASLVINVPWMDLSVEQSDALGRTLTTWWASSLSGVIGKDSPGYFTLATCVSPSNPPGSYVFAGTVNVEARAVCPKGVNFNGSFECRRVPLVFTMTSVAIC